MFRNPREKWSATLDLPVKPSVGRAPSPPLNTNDNCFVLPATSKPAMTTKTTPLITGSSKVITPKVSARKEKPSVPKNPKTKPNANGSILSFFKKAQAQDGKSAAEFETLFIEDSTDHCNSISKTKESVPNEHSNSVVLVEEAAGDRQDESPEADSRFNEYDGSVKRRKLSISPTEQLLTREGDENEKGLEQESPIFPAQDAIEEGQEADAAALRGQDSGTKRYVGPFLDESDSEDEDHPDEKPQDIESQEENAERRRTITITEVTNALQIKREDFGETVHEVGREVPNLKREATSYVEQDAFEGFEGLDDFDDEFAEGEEFVERRWMREQRRLEMEAGDFEEDLEDGDSDAARGTGEPQEDCNQTKDARQSNSVTPICPICNASFRGISDQEASVHVNHCLDGKPTPLNNPEPAAELKTDTKTEAENQPLAAGYRRPVRPAKPGQDNPFMLGTANGATGSAFSRLMSGHAEDAAWATAAAAEYAARGKPAYQRTCPFYKILPGFYTCVDAFRYGAVQGCNAYFLSHFHSDHYVGLTSTWCHGPIYCSHVTANLVRQQLRVDPKWVIDLEFEKKVEVPNTEGVHVTMIPANHCPGSSIYLFEKNVGKSLKIPKIQRVLHCGDFRACPAHVEHPLLRPEVMDMVSGKTAQQKIDVCYLDTTYLNPKYAFPSQEDVIQACADMCVSLNKSNIDDSDGWEKMQKDRAGGTMAKFVRKDSTDDMTSSNNNTNPTTTSSRGRLLVIVGTYSIGKERICLGIARALDTKIYAPPAKQRICACLEDPELNSRLTTDPRLAQVHMTPLFEIRADTLGDYLADYSDRFSRCVGFRPSGWNYRPPGGRFTESPAVGSVLHSESWKSGFGMRDLAPQRGSTDRAKCFGVPYSEHSSFRELTMFCCALRIDRVVPTVNVGSAKGREKMKVWCERWAAERKKNGLFRTVDAAGKGTWYPARGTMELRTNL